MTRFKLVPLLAVLSALPGTGHADTLPPHLDPAAFEPRAAIDNRYFPVMPGPGAVMAAMPATGAGEESAEESQLTFAGAGPVVLGVQTTVLVDRTFQEDVLHEETRNLLAQDRAGNVWFLGEDVLNFHYDEAGRLTGTDTQSSWRAGANGALAGIAMPADPAPGASFVVEYDPANKTVEEAQVIGTADKVDGPAGAFADVVTIYQTSPLDPDFREVRQYAPGVGLVRAEEGVDANRANPEVVIELSPEKPAP